MSSGYKISKLSVFTRIFFSVLVFATFGFALIVNVRAGFSYATDKESNAPYPNRIARIEAIFIVNSIGDDSDANSGNGVCETAAGNGICTLRAAVQEANAFAGDDAIQFSSLFNTAQTISLNGQIIISSNLTITGTGADILTLRNTAATGSTSRVFNVSLGSTVSLSGMTITGGRLSSSNHGGGIFSNGNLSVLNCVITDNILGSAGAGGGIFSSGGSLTVTNCTVSGNIAGGSGGGIVSNDSSLAVTNCTVSGNVASGSGGGIISASATSTVSTVTNSIINGNTAAGLGGGGIRQSGGTMNVINSTISNNTSTVIDSGGGIDSSFGVLSVTNSTISGNTVTTSLNSNGGGIWISSGTTITNSTITNNKTGSTIGASGIFRQANGPTATVRNSIIAGNQNNATQPDVIGAFATVGGGFNLIGNVGTATGFNQTGDQTGTGASPLNPMLAGLNLNGGTTQTHALLPNSPAIDKGASFGSSTDQRGFVRPFENPGIPNAADGSDIGAFEQNPAFDSNTPCDFDGDGKTDISIFRPSSGEWWYIKSSNGGNTTAKFGISSDELTPADFTGDGKADIAFWRPSTGAWFILRSENNTFFSFPLGTSGDIPAPADYNNDGKADAAVFRPSTGTWFISLSSGGTTIQQFGQNGDVPVVADYDGDGRADIAIYRPSAGEWWIQRSASGLIALQFGIATDKPVQGDYTGDGRADIAFFRPSNGNWFVLRSENNSFFSFPFGTTDDIPSPGDYDGDGIFDATVFRPSNATWFIQRSMAGVTIVGFGLSTDKPVPNAFVP